MDSHKQLRDILNGLILGQPIAVSHIDPEIQKFLQDVDVIDTAAEYLSNPTAYLDAQVIESACSPQVINWLNRPVEVLSVTESTNTILVERQISRSIAGSVICAELQTGGRGRRGRSWISPFARNVMFSVSVTLNRNAQNLGSLSLVVGLAITNVLDKLAVPGVELKWPNDVLVNFKKLCGVLVELVGTDRPAVVVIGIGMNVYAAPRHLPHGALAATSLVEYVPHIDRNEVIATILNELVPMLADFEAHSLAPFAESWRERDALRDREISVTMGSETTVGTCRGIDSDGALLLETPHGIERVIGGDISIRSL